MLRHSFRTLTLGLLLAALAEGGSGYPAGSTGRFRFRLTASRPELESPGGAGVVPRIAGFGHNGRPGEPMLPLKVLLVAIPEGVTPRLRVLSSPADSIGTLDVAPVPRLRVPVRQEHPRSAARRTGPGTQTSDQESVQEYDVEYARDEAIYGRDEDFPSAPVRLGQIGYLREQRYVEVLFSPVAVDPARGRATFFGDVQAEILFEGAGPSRPFLPDPLFEDVYRRSLLNYEQGRLFRVGPAESASPSAATPLATAPATAPLTATQAVAQPVTAAAATGRYKLSVSQAGVYRLDYSYLQANAPDLLQVDPGTLTLSAEGVEVPVSIRAAGGGSGEADGRFDPGDFLEFYGRPKGGPFAHVNYDFGGAFPAVYQADDFTDTQVYWLTSSGAPGSHPRIPAVSGAPQASAPPIAGDFEDTAVFDENNALLPLDDNDPFYSIPSLLAGSTQATRDISLPLPGLAPATYTSTVTVRLRGASSVDPHPDHRTIVWVNNDTAGTVNYTWDGEVINVTSLQEPQAVLANPTTIHFSLPGISGVSIDHQFIDTVTIKYRRLFSAAGDALTFSYPNQDVRFQVGGFSGAAPVVYEITGTVAGSPEASPVQITGAAVSGSPTTTFTFDVARDSSAGAPATRTFVALGPTAIRRPDAIARAADPVLHDPQSGADIIVVASRATVDPSPGGALDNLLAYRQSSQGLTSKVVFIDQIYDEFSYGLRDPNAIRAFLSYAFDNWKGPSGTARPPSFLLLVGDASSDYKNTLNRSDWVDQVPTQIMFAQNSFFGYYASDNWLASIRGNDQIPDLFVGRISTRTAADSAAVFDKIRSYEQSPPPGLWKGRAVLLAGDDKVAGNGDSSLFESIQNRVASTYFATAPYSVPSPPLYFAEPPWSSSDVAGFKNAIVSQLQSGAAVLSFIGHGSFETWGTDTFFTTTDAEALTNGAPVPFMVNVNCLSGGFNDLNTLGSLGEGMTNNPNGGAVGTLAPAGLSIFFVGDVVTDQFFGTLFGPTRERGLGAATLNFKTALWSQGSIIDLQSYTYLGDPATRIVTPAPAPPTQLQATAGNGQVTLSWVASPEIVAGYRIYRGTLPSGPYAPITCDPLSPTSCVDRTVINATTYYYYAVSLDGDGFQGRWSNFNSDCDTGPDCVQARPINPNPPATPTGLTVTDPGTGGVLSVSWSANPERDLRQYTLSYGLQLGGPYPLKVTVPPTKTSTLLTGLSDGVRYYMVLSATNTSGLESQPTAEASGTSHLIQGIAPPRSITDLTLSISGSDLVLSWSQPTVDIYGRPTTVVSYIIYASILPSFVPTPAMKIGTNTGGSNTRFVHTGAAVLPGSLYYLVVAVDANGFVSGAGRDLPNGIQTLSVALVGTSPLTVRLTWPAVTTDIQGYPTLIDHYQVHRTATPVSRSSLGASTIFRDNLKVLTVDLDLTGAVGPSYFSVIAVDDRGNLSPF